MLSIARLALQCRTAHDHPAPHDVRTRLRRIAEHDLPGQLSTHLDETVAPADTRIVLIRRLRVRLHLDPAGDPTAMARAFAAAIAAGIRAAGDDTDAAVVFADDVEQLARLLLDLAAGTAWTCWYHRQAFPGLLRLPVSAAIRTLAEDCPRRFLAATARMTARSLEGLGAAVDTVDAARMLTALGAAVAEAGDGPTLDARLLHPMAGPAPAVSALTTADDDPTTTAPPTRRDGSAVWATPHGALFVLLPYMVEAGSLLADPVRRRGMAVALAGPSVLDDAAVAALLAWDADEDGDTDVLRHEATLDWLTRVHAIGPVQPAIGTARLSGKRIRVVVDHPTGHWLAIGAGRGTAATLRAITDRFGVSDDRRWRHLTRELRRLGAARDVELGDCMTATNLIRRVANSLPGFAAAATAHVWRQALDTAAEVTITDDGWRVRVHRSPLAEVLRLCGHGDRTTSVPWLDDRTVRVVIDS